MKSIKKLFNKKKETSIELKIKEVLIDSDISFVQEAKIIFGKYRKKFDFYCYKRIGEELLWDFLIETDGDYWHPLVFNENEKGILKGTRKNKTKKLSKSQKKNLLNDRIKNAISRKLGLKLLRFTEGEINSNINEVKQKILNLIENFEDLKMKSSDDLRDKLL